MKKDHIQLTDVDKSYLESLLSKGSLPVKVFKRSTALLELDRGKTFQEVSSILGVSYQSVSSWRDRYLSEGLLCLHDKPRSGRPIEIDGNQRAKITALACSDAPKGYGRWSLRLLADRTVELEYCEKISYSEVRLILKKTNSSPISSEVGVLAR